MSIKIDDFDKSMSTIMEELKIDVDDAVKKSIDNAVKYSIRELRSKSPKKTGEYAKGWRKKVEVSRIGRYETIVYQDKKPTLSHLLEYGHKFLNTDEFVDGIEHIKPVRDEAEKMVVCGIKIELK